MIRSARFLNTVVALLGLVAISASQTPLPPNVKIEEKLGAQIPLDLEFKNEDGKTVKLREFFKERPVALMLIFYKCGGTCLTELQEATKSFRALKTYDIGRDFDVLTVSIHPKEEPWLAKNTEDIWTETYGRPTAKEGWHFLTGPEEASRALADSVGFSYEYLPKENTVRHPNALIVLTPDGKVSQYFKGLLYPQKLLLASLQKAKGGEIGENDPNSAGGCIQNPSEGKYTAIVNNVLKVGGTIFLVALVGTIFVMTRRKDTGNVPASEEEPAG